MKSVWSGRLHVEGFRGHLEGLSTGPVLVWSLFLRNVKHELTCGTL